MADASCSAAASLSAQLSLIYGTATKAPHIRRFTSHPRYSVASLLTTPRTSTTQPQGIISNTPQKSVGCLRMRLRLCLRVAKIRTFAPLLVPLRCAGTIALLSDFCSAGWAAHATFLSQGIISDTPQDFAGCLLFVPREKSEIFPAGTPFVPAALPRKVSEQA